MSASRSDWMREGEILAGKYKVERVMAKGGMGVVVAAIHQQLDQRVALKFMLPEGVENAGAVSRFLREARAAVRLRSEHVARVLDVGTAEGGSPYIVMEYLEGEDLSSLLERERQLAIRPAVTYLLQACEAVAEAHAIGIIHRDLKPANLFLTRRPDGSPCVKVLDFGVAKQVDSIDNGHMTKAQTILGTPFYMSPEQLRSSKDVDARTDIWALGMVLYELLLGHVAFERETLPELCSAILTAIPAAPRTIRADIPFELERVMLRSLEKEPDARYPSLAEFAAALAPFASGNGAERRIKRTLLGGIAAPSDAPPAELGEEVPESSPSHARTVNGAATLLGGSVPELVMSDAEPSTAAGTPAKNARTRLVILGAVAVLVVGAIAGTGAVVGRARAARPAASESTSPMVPASLVVLASDPFPARGVASGAVSGSVSGGAPGSASASGSGSASASGSGSASGPAPGSPFTKRPAARAPVVAVPAPSARTPRVADDDFGPRK